MRGRMVDMKGTIMRPPLFYSFISSDPAASSLIRTFQIIRHFSWELPQQLLGFLMGLYLLTRGTVNRSDHFFKGVLFIETSSFGRAFGNQQGKLTDLAP